MEQTTLHALIVDDNYYNRDLCLLALNHLNVTAEQAENGEEAINLLASKRFDLLLLDLAMPLIDGFTVLEKLDEMNLRDNLIVVVITAHSHLAESVEASADFIMYKPIDIQLFTQFLQRIQRAHI